MRVVGAVLLLVAPCALGSMWVTSHSKRYSICAMPKVGITELLEYVRFTELSAAEICSQYLLAELQPELLKATCAGIPRPCTSSNTTGCNIDYDRTITANLIIKNSEDPSADPCVLQPTGDACTKYARLAVGRDPLSRLFSAFRNKLEQSEQNETKFQLR